MKLIVSFLLVFFSINSFSQSLLVGIPSADVAEKHHLEITHETQYNFWDKPAKWNSFNFACYGLGNGLEITATLNNLSNQGSTNLAIGAGAKKVFSLYKQNPWESKITIGGNLIYGTYKQDFGVWTYGHYSFRIPKLKTRFTGGLNYGESQTFGYRTVMKDNKQVNQAQNLITFIGGVEQPLFKNVSFIADWYSGTHDLAAFIPAMQFDFGHNVLILGYKIPNNIESGNQALIVEFMLTIPDLKSKK